MAVVVVGREGIRGASLFGSGKLAGVKTHAEMSEDIAREFFSVMSLAIPADVWVGAGKPRIAKNP
jgi:hypothetical protein